MQNGARVGMNLQELVDFSPEQAFRDLMKQSRDWTLQTPTGPQAMSASQLDANGYPLSLAQGTLAFTLMCWNMQGDLHYRDGPYSVLYDGTGSLQYTQGHGPCQVVSTSHGHDVINLSSSLGGLMLRLASTNPSDHVRNIRVVPSGTEASTDQWNPDFLATLAGYDQIRFMWWMHATINLPASQAVFQTTWALRPKPTDRSWDNQNGVPIEVIVDLCNRVGADPWLNVSHLADDDYVTQLGSYVGTHLNPGLKAYIEHSNEVWNGVYTQAQYARQQGVAQGLDTNPTLAGAKWHSARSVHIFNLFTAAMGDPSRVVRVMGSFVANQGISRTCLEWQSASLHTDALAIAPYFGPQQTLADTTTLDQLFGMLSGSEVPATAAQVAQQSSVAQAHNVTLVAYEGGPSFASTPQTTATINALFDAVNRDPRMGDACTQMLDAWRAANGREFVWYSSCMGYGPFGRYGVLEYLTQPRATAPKYEALQAWIARHAGNSQETDMNVIHAFFDGNISINGISGQVSDIATSPSVSIYINLNSGWLTVTTGGHSTMIAPHHIAYLYTA